MSHHRSTRRSAPQVPHAAHAPSRFRQDVQSHPDARGQEFEHAPASSRRTLRHTGSNVTNVSLRVQSVNDTFAPPAYSSPMPRRPVVDSVPLDSPTAEPSTRGEQNHRTATRTRKDPRVTPHSSRGIDVEHVAPAADVDSPHAHAHAQYASDCGSPVCRLEKGVYMRLLMDIYGVRAHASCRCGQDTESELSELGGRHYGRHSIDRVSAGEEEGEGDEPCGDSDVESEVSTSSTDAVVGPSLQVNTRATVRTSTPSPVLEGATLQPESSFNDVAGTRGKSRHSSPIQMNTKIARSPDTPIFNVLVHPSPGSSSVQPDLLAEEHGERDEKNRKMQNTEESAIPADSASRGPIQDQDESSTVSTPDSHAFQTCLDTPPEEISTEGVRGVPFASEQPAFQQAPTTFAYLPTGTPVYPNSNIGSAAGGTVPAYTFFIPATTGPVHTAGSSVPQAFYVPFGAPPPPTSCGSFGCAHGAAAASPGWSLHANDGTLTHRDVQYKISGVVRDFSLRREYLAVESRVRSQAGRLEDAGDAAPVHGRIVSLNVIDKPLMYGEPDARRLGLRTHRMMTQFSQDGRKWLRGVERSWSDELNVFYIMNAVPCTLDAWIKSTQVEDIPFRTYVAEMILILCELQAAAIVHRAIDPISLGVSLTGHLCLDFCDNAVVRGDLEAAPKYFPRGPLLLYTPPEVFAHCQCNPDGLVYLASDMAPAAVSDTYDVWCMGICILEMFWPGPQPLLHDDALSTLSSEEFRARLANPDLDRLTVMRYLSNRHPTLLDLVHKMTDTDPTKRWTADRLKAHAFFDGVDWEEIEQQIPLPRCPVINRHVEAGESILYSGQLDEDGRLPLLPEALRGILEDAGGDGDVWECWPAIESMKAV